MPFQNYSVQYQSLTQTVYELIRDQQYIDVIDILKTKLQLQPKSRALLSLLAYCQYHSDDFESATEQYQQLLQICPENADYITSYAQCLFKCGQYEEALSIMKTIQKDTEEGLQLSLAIAYQIGDIQKYQSLLDRCDQSDDVQRLINVGCLHYKEGEFTEARQLFMEALDSAGFQPDLAYNCAVCSYELGEMGPSLEYVSAILDYCSTTFPELQLQRVYGALKVRNSRLIKESHLVEAFNLKAAIEFRLGNMEGARRTLYAMPFRDESDVDPVSLYNSALINSDDDPEAAFEKLKHLLMNPPFPPQTIETLLLLCCHSQQQQQYSIATDILTEYQDLANLYVQLNTRSFVETIILRKISPEDCLSRLEQLCETHVSQLRRLKKRLSEDPEQQANNGPVTTGLVSNYTAELENYISVLMALAQIHYEDGHFHTVEKLLLSSVEFFSEHKIWKTNFAHNLFIQGNKFEEAIEYYESIIKQNERHLLDITAVILANLCAAYIMTNQNDLAETIMREVELEESEILTEESEEHPVHLCIINLVIGTLYCSKGNFDFGISRVIKSFEPYEAKLDMHTWHYAKKCFLSLLEALSKHLTQLQDDRFFQTVAFLQEIEVYGNEMPSESNGATISEEARKIKKVFTHLWEDNRITIK